MNGCADGAEGFAVSWFFFAAKDRAAFTGLVVGDVVFDQIEPFFSVEGLCFVALFPAQIISLDGMTAVAEMSGIKKEIDVTLTPEVAPGDWVVVHVGYALQRIDPQKALETLEAMRTAGSLGSEAVAAS